MNNRPEFFEILRYMDAFHADVSQLVVLAEQLLDEQGFEALPKAGNRASGNLTTHYRVPTHWRIRYVYRYFIPKEVKRPETSLFILIYLGLVNTFTYPPVLCAKLHHAPLSANSIYDKVYSRSKLRSLFSSSANWHEGRWVDGWSLAKPNFDSPVEEIRGYLLNLFDLQNRELVVENVVKPLTDPDCQYDPAVSLTRYPFPFIAANERKIDPGEII